MKDKLPPMPEPLTMSMVARRDDFAYTAAQIRAYGQQCRQQALEEAALACRYMRGFTYEQCSLFENAVLALRDKP